MDVALAHIGAAFDEAAVVNDFKTRVERWLCLAPDHPALRARFGGYGALLAGRRLHEAAASIEQRWRDERKAFQIASALGCGTRLALEVLRELRLILRFMRAQRMETEFRDTVAAWCDRPPAIAAE